MSSISKLYHGFGIIKSSDSQGTDARNRARTNKQKARFNTQKRFFLVHILPNQDRNFSGGLDLSGYLGFYNNWDFCGSLIHSLSSRTLENLSLDNGGSRPGNNGRNDMRDIRKINKRVLHFCDLLIKLFDTTLCLFNNIFLHLQIF